MLGFEVQKTGKHVAADGAYLRVWKMVDGKSQQP